MFSVLFQDCHRPGQPSCVRSCQDVIKHNHLSLILCQNFGKQMDLWGRVFIIDKILTVMNIVCENEDLTTESQSY